MPRQTITSHGLSLTPYQTEGLPVHERTYALVDESAPDGPRHLTDLTGLTGHRVYLCLKFWDRVVAQGHLRRHFEFNRITKQLEPQSLSRLYQRVFADQCLEQLYPHVFSYPNCHGAGLWVMGWGLDAQRPRPQYHGILHTPPPSDPPAPSPPPDWATLSEVRQWRRLRNQLRETGAPLLLHQHHHSDPDDPEHTLLALHPDPETDSIIVFDKKSPLTQDPWRLRRLFWSDLFDGGHFIRVDDGQNYQHQRVNPPLPDSVDS